MQFALKHSPVVTLAHFSKASTQILDDFASLGRFIDVQMRYGLSLRKEAQMLYGSGLGNNLAGLMQGAPPFVDGTSGATRIGVLWRAAADLFAQATALYDRWTARVEVATENEADFIHNMVTIRAESRLALATHTTAGMRRGTFA